MSRQRVGACRDRNSVHEVGKVLLADSVTDLKQDTQFAKCPEFEHLLAKISGHFLRLDAHDLEAGIEEALKDLCEATGTDRAAFLEISPNGAQVSAVHSFSNNENSWTTDNLARLGPNHLQWLRQQLASRQVVDIPHVKELPESAAAERAFLIDQGIDSLACAPLFEDDRLHAVVCFAAAGSSQPLHREHFELMRVGAEILSAATRKLRTELELAASREWLELAQRAGHSAAWEWHPDDDSIVFSSTTAEIFNVRDGLLPTTGAELMAFIPKEDHRRILSTFRKVFKSGEPYVLEHRFQAPGQGTVWALVRGEVQLNGEGRVAKVMGVSADITERKRAEHELQRIKERAQVTLSSINDGVVRTDAGGRIDFLNPSAEEMMGVPLAKARGQLVSTVYRPENGNSVGERPHVVEQCLSSRHAIEPADASLLRRNDGSELMVRESAAPIFDDNGELIGAVLVLTDVSQLHSLQRRMQHLAAHDPLTGLINRREFELRLADAISEAASGSRKFALCYLDLDEFKVVNDTCGHGAGDQMLKQLTSIFAAEIPENDTLARLGGDEFGILYADCTMEQASINAQNVLDAVRKYRFQWQDRVFDVGASVGIVPVAGGTGNLSELLSAADSACYVAKDRGRNEIHIGHAGDTELTLRHTEMQWIDRINRALQENRFRLYKQPIRPLQDHRQPEYNELLLRLEDVHGSILAPSQFITAAERYRMMPAIDLWVVGAALDLIAGSSLPTESHSPSFTINLSGQSFGNEELKRLILDGLDRLEIPPRRVMFEITETAAIANLAKALEFMRTLRDRGCRFILDDFGSGLSSFRYLKSLEVDFLKIDGELVREIADDPIQREMVAAIHRIGESMGIQTIGEWVENTEIEGTLREIGVDYAQGWGVGRPVPFTG